MVCASNTIPRHDRTDLIDDLKETHFRSLINRRRKEGVLSPSDDRMSTDWRTMHLAFIGKKGLRWIQLPDPRLASEWIYLGDPLLALPSNY